MCPRRVAVTKARVFFLPGGFAMTGGRTICSAAAQGTGGTPDWAGTNGIFDIALASARRPGARFEAGLLEDVSGPLRLTVSTGSGTTGGTP